MHLSLDNPDDILIWLYLIIDDLFRQTELPWYIDRFSNNRFPYFSDAELLTSAIFPILMGYLVKKDGYRYIQRHYRTWFPKLPTYEVWNRRLNRSHEALIYLDRLIRWCFANVVGQELIIDTIPIIVCQAQHSARAAAASPFVSKGYCAAKKQYYIGAKVQLLGVRRPGQMPMPLGYVIATAKEHDLTIAEDSLSDIAGVTVYGDKAYIDRSFQLELFEQYTNWVVPVKQKRNGPPLGLFDQAFNSLHASVRQPIESLAAWINKKTRIEDSSRIRSIDGLFTHIASKMVAALLLLVFNL